jgi:hypothetical protein
MADRTPIYELHIQPLFRLIDKEHMALFFNLGDYDAVKQHANTIKVRLQSGMPPDSTGGPWPSELVTMFARWVAAGCPRLSLGRGLNYQLSKSGTSYHLECNVDLPNDTSQCWLDIVDAGPAHRSYRLYIEAGASGGPANVAVMDDFENSANIQAVTVYDAAGPQTVSVTGS